MDRCSIREELDHRDFADKERALYLHRDGYNSITPPRKSWKTIVDIWLWADFEAIKQRNIVPHHTNIRSKYALTTIHAIRSDRLLVLQNLARHRWAQGVHRVLLGDGP